MSEKRINILHLQNHLNISCGISKTIYLIAKNTSSRFQHYVVCFGGDGMSRFESINIKPFVLKDRNNSVFGIIRHLIKIYSYCEQNEINIIHSHHRYFDMLVRMIKSLKKIKTITSVHSRVFNKKYFSYKADILIACSKSIKEHLINNYEIDEGRIKIIYNTVDPNEVSPIKTKSELISELNIPVDKFIIGYFGRMDFNEKGVDILLKAFLNPNKVNKNMFLLLIGNGKDEGKIRDLITRNKLSAKLINAQIDIFNYYKLIDILVLPSRIDPFPLVMLEAGLMQKPFIGSNVDGITELIEHEKDGLLFESENVDDLKNQILRIFKDKKLTDTIAKNLNKKVLESYTIDKTELLIE